jgi:hypothetical protein
LHQWFVCALRSPSSFKKIRHCAISCIRPPLLCLYLPQSISVRIHQKFQSSQETPKKQRLNGERQIRFGMYDDDCRSVLSQTNLVSLRHNISRSHSIENFVELYGAFGRKENGIMKTFVQTRLSGLLVKGIPGLSIFEVGV